ncbi:MAG: type II secretion system secretin GspD [Natronospirillum sp.]|uniref:type II secretion system secretin GspD n=1 Tax=Natronospirillum sp. TaxID=2812955 RepID=UPI0025F1525B|nr:type II secretion system secretin GspD [Natronospirillum sp.]MCH8551439.1 type II secretion system secretin GspD [Natronospirillum sp.]
MDIKSILRPVMVALCLCLLSGALLAETFRINHQEADLKQFINQVADITGKTFVLDPRVRGQVTVISDEELTEEQVYEVFLAVLQMQGFTVAERGNEVHVIPVNDAKQITGPVIEGELPLSRDFVTRVITLDNLSAMELIPILRPVGASYGHMSGIPSANAILMVDHAENIARIEQILNRLDVATESDIRMLPLESAWVGDVLELLQALIPNELASRSGGEDAIQGSLRLVADERSNRLIARGSPEVLDFVEELVRELDVESQAARGNTEVIFLDNGDAMRMAELLRGLGSESSNGANGEGQRRTELSILADEELNALIVRAEPDDMSEIKRIIDQLDIPRAQVLIEAAIVEVSGSLSEQFGIQAGLLHQGDGTAPALLGANVRESTAQSILSGGLPISQIGEGGLFAGVGGTEGDVSFAAIIQALETQSNTNLLSTPYVMTMDNSEARLVVGETVPFRRADPSDDNPFTITREDVATEITVRPNIQQNDVIRLAINQKTEELIGAASLESRTSKREIDTNVLVGNGETIILGGMVKDRVIDTERKVPLLGDLPIIGGLFRSTSSEHEKVNLLVVIRPSIARERTTDQARERYLGIWDLRFGPEGPEMDAVISPPSFDELYRGIQTIEDE